MSFKGCYYECMAHKHNKHSYRRNIMVMVLVLLGFFVILPQLSSFNESLATLRNADFVYVLFGLLWWFSTFCSAAIVYIFLSKKPLVFSKTLLVQLAGGFANRLAPSGAGAIATSIRYLVKRGYPTTQASTIVAVNNILGFVGTFILLVSLMISNGQPLSHYFRPNLQISSEWTIILGFVLVVVLGLLLLSRKKVMRVGRSIWSTAKSIAREPLRLFGALCASIAITIGYALTLYSVGLAFNVHIHAVQVLLVTTLGVAAASITPTPGGIGGAEVGLAAGLVAVGVQPHQAITVALVYRFITYWLAIIPGLISLQIALRKNYI